MLLVFAAVVVEHDVVVIDVAAYCDAVTVDVSITITVFLSLLNCL